MTLDAVTMADLTAPWLVILVLGVAAFVLGTYGGRGLW